MPSAASGRAGAGRRLPAWNGGDHPRPVPFAVPLCGGRPKLARMSTASAPPSTAEDEGTDLKRGITGPLLFLFILGDVLGAGVYVSIGEVGGIVGGPVWLALLTALVLALLTAASYAELVTKYPRAGGAAVFAQHAYRRPLVSFVVGWCMLAAGVVSVAALALGFAGTYLPAFVDAPAAPAAVALLAVVALVNLRGIKESLGANVVMTVVEVSGLLLVIALAALVLGRGDGDLAQAAQFKGGVAPVSATLAAALLAFYSFVGFETSANVAEEVRDVRRVYPRALFGALLVAGLVYVLVALSAAAVLSADTLGAGGSSLLDVVAASGAGVPDWLFGAIALVAIANGALLTSIMASRLTFGMAEQGLLPAVLGRVLPRRRTPWVAILVTTAVSMALALLGGTSEDGFATLASTVVLLLLVVFTSTNLAVLVLRRDRVGREHYRAPTALPVLALASCAVLLTQVRDPLTWALAGGLVLLGVVVHLVTRGASRRDAVHPR